MSADESRRRPLAKPAKVKGVFIPAGRQSIQAVPADPIVLSLEGNRLQFPDMCCGCGRGQVSGVFTAFSQKEVIGGRKSSEFPMCSGCLAWDRAFSEAMSARGRMRTAKAKARWGFQLGVITSGLMLSMVIVALLTETWGPLVMIIFPAPVVVAAWVDWVRSRLKIARLRAEYQDAVGEADRLAPDGAVEPWPVEYLDWYRDVRTFRFHNAAFAAALAMLNRPAIVRYHMD